MPSATTRTTAHPFQTDEPRLRAVHEKVVANQRLDEADVAALYASKDILAIGWLANHVRERMHGTSTRFAVGSIAISDAARVATCALCGKVPLAADIARQMDQLDVNPDEVVVIDGDPRNHERLLHAIATVKQQQPKARVLAAIVPDIAGGAAELCQSLRAAGADGLAGSGPEVFIPLIRHQLWQHSGSPRTITALYGAAQAAGLSVPLHVVQRPTSTPEQQAAEMMAIRNLANDATSFAALSFDPDASTGFSHPVTTGMQEMKQIAMARLALDNVAHIRAYWHMLGGKLLQIALRFGASELDGTPLDPGVNREIRRRELAREIEVAGREPQETKAPRTAIVLA